MSSSAMQFMMIDDASGQWSPREDDVKTIEEQRIYLRGLFREAAVPCHVVTIGGIRDGAIPVLGPLGGVCDFHSLGMPMPSGAGVERNFQATEHRE